MLKVGRRRCVWWNFRCESRLVCLFLIAHGTDDPWVARMQLLRNWLMSIASRSLTARASAIRDMRSLCIAFIGWIPITGNDDIVHVLGHCVCVDSV
jgi:hypothetical protein